MFKSQMQFFAPEGTKWAKGHLYALMGHLVFHIRALIATAELGNYPHESLSLPLKGHGQGRWTLELVESAGRGGGGGRLLPQNSNPQ